MLLFEEDIDNKVDDDYLPRSPKSIDVIQNVENCKNSEINNSALLASTKAAYYKMLTRNARRKHAEQQQQQIEVGKILSPLLHAQQKTITDRRRSKQLHDSEAVNKAVCRALANVSSESSCAMEILDRGCVPKLLTLIGSQDKRVQEACATVLRNIRTHKIDASERRARESTAHFQTK